MQVQVPREELHAMPMPRPTGSIRNTFRCPVAWRSMVGDAHARHCSSCDAMVYDLVGLSEAEVVTFITLHAGTVCGRLCWDRSGRVIHGACTQGSQTRLGKLSVDPDPLRHIDAEILTARKRARALKALRALVATATTKVPRGRRSRASRPRPI